ncbi:hypothetical protein H2200_006309 [Cladophialophora chaetospira]|uniref:Uncharacterized protein n=1 Tax=Cladophialophora chaetospira TaxID=386627 RepID=A0AA38XAN9_9EURO|nr:hypothetical protein H2200_006309 [Cladophialophora chaetospira]
MKRIRVAGALLAITPLSLAQFFPAAPTGLTNITSKVNKQVQISYKETHICETTPGVKSYSGYVYLPGSVLADVGGFDINTFFLYVEARHNASTAPLGVYFAGGPGESSIYTGMASESGPCYVNVAGNDTTLNPWSFNNDVNMLFIDQPVQTGFSFDTLVNGTYNLTDEIIQPLDFNSSFAAYIDPLTSFGTFSTQDPLHTTNTTVSSGRAVWHFAEHWLSSFPKYTTSSDKISFWGNSYGGWWVPEAAAQFAKNIKTLPAKHPLKHRNMKFDTLGITNGCIDFEYGLTGFPQYAYNNTYGVHFYSEAQYNQAMENITSPGGALDLIRACRAAGLAGDPTFLGNNETVNEICEEAFAQSFSIISASDALNNRSAFDIAVHQPEPCTFDIAVTNYLNRPDVQEALGVPLNFTYDSNLMNAVYGFPVPQYAFLGTGDPVRQAGLPNLEYLLANGVKVTLVYGDRDYRCPWTGAETTAKAAKWAHQQGFHSAGYEKIQGVKGGRQGVVKQFGLLSFSRVFDAGHAVNAYAPEAVYRIFERAMSGKDIATGSKPAIAVGYHTTGPTDSWSWRNTLPADVPHTCMVEGNWTATNPWEPLLGPQ